jgi:hypothetical protein
MNIRPDSFFELERRLWPEKYYVDRMVERIINHASAGLKEHDVKPADRNDCIAGALLDRSAILIAFEGWTKDQFLQFAASSFDLAADAVTPRRTNREIERSGKFIRFGSAP